MEKSNAREKFVDLAEKRVTKAIKNLRLIGNLSNKSNYSYDETDVKKIISALDAEIKDLKQKFSQKSEISDAVFKLD